jgi:hypothetical protein
MIDRGNSAYPHSHKGYTELDSHITYVAHGLTIRQVYFKAALQGLCSNYSNLNRESGMIENIVAMAFKIADTAIKFENDETKAMEKRMEVK